MSVLRQYEGLWYELRRAAGAFQVGAVAFSNQYGHLGRTSQAKELMDAWSTL